MEKGEPNVIRKSEQEWLEIKRRLGFSVDGAAPKVLVMPENLKSKVREFFMELIGAQVLLEVFEGERIDGSVLERLRHGLLKEKHSRKKLALEAKNIDKIKLNLIIDIAEMFSKLSEKVQSVLALLELEHKNTNEYKVLEKLSILLREFIFNLEKFQESPAFTLEDTERIISEFNKNLSEFL
jgi:hypothetical protein